MKRIRLTENQLHRVIKESVNRVMMQEGMLDTAPMAGEMPRGNEQKVQQAIGLAQEGLAQLQSLGALNPQSAPFVSNDEGTSFYMSQKRGTTSIVFYFLLN